MHHETFYSKELASFLRKQNPDSVFLDGLRNHYGTEAITDKYAIPDILHIERNGDIHLIEVKKVNNNELDKWLVLGQLHFYTFLIDTQLAQDTRDYTWLLDIILRALNLPERELQELIDSIEAKYKSRKKLVESWNLAIIGGEKEQLQKDEMLWNMHDYINLSLDSNEAFRPFCIIHISEDSDGSLDFEPLNSWFHEKHEEG